MNLFSIIDGTVRGSKRQYREEKDESSSTEESGILNTDRVSVCV